MMNAVGIEPSEVCDTYCTVSWNTSEKYILINIIWLLLLLEGYIAYYFIK